jgi:hypothetical protein
VGHRFHPCFGASRTGHIPKDGYAGPQGVPGFTSYRERQKRSRRRHPTPGAQQTMAFFLILLPFMILALAIAAAPLLVLTAREHRLRTAEVPARHRPRR